jgi:MFS family permease
MSRRGVGESSFFDIFKLNPLSSFHRSYLIVYFLAVCSDWLQGPYVYALYSKYGFKNGEIGQLFVAGFGSSMLLGTVVGSFADALGRKKFCYLYAFFYIISCLTKHFNSYWILMFGRITGGIATSLLFSVFESWVVCENTKKGYGADSLNTIFSLSVLGNSIVAITSGGVAQIASDYFKYDPGFFNTGSYVVPFDVAIGVLVALVIIMHFSWEENYGDSTDIKSVTTSMFNSSALVQALGVVQRNKQILVLGLIQSCFEGSMYSFVFEWTPALTSTMSEDIPFGTIFGTFMVGCMLGSQIFGYAVKKLKIEVILIFTFLLSAVSFSFVFIDSIFQTRTAFYGFILFEICVGIYFPCMSTLKSKIVPEEHRSSIYNLYRVPLNAIVIFVLLSNLSVNITFGICVVLLCIAALLQAFISSTS